MEGVSCRSPPSSGEAGHRIHKGVLDGFPLDLDRASFERLELKVRSSDSFSRSSRFHPVTEENYPVNRDIVEEYEGVRRSTWMASVCIATVTAVCPSPNEQVEVS